MTRCEKTDEARAQPAFGALAPNGFQQLCLDTGRRLPPSPIGRRMASLLLRLAGGKSGRAFDMFVFDSQKARLRPFDNISEKRVFITPQFWEADERRALADFIRGDDGVFTFVDVGANAGLYTLFARSIATSAGRRFRAACIEPAEEMVTRLRFNLDASGALKDAMVFPVATGAHAGEAAFAINRANRGESRLLDTGSIRVPVRPLAQIADEAGLSRIDALKIDIEGGEYETLFAYFAASGAHFWPTLIIAEISHERAEQSLDALLMEKGYRLQVKTARNAVYSLPQRAAPQSS